MSGLAGSDGCSIGAVEAEKESDQQDKVYRMPFGVGGLEWSE
jgi:hypothetical protein